MNSFRLFQFAKTRLPDGQESPFFACFLTFFHSVATATSAMLSTGMQLKKGFNQSKNN